MDFSFSRLSIWIKVYGWTFLVILIAIVTDQVSKVWAKETLRGQGTYHYLGDFFRLQYSENPGAFLSLGADLSESARFWIFVVLVSGFLLMAGYYMLKSIGDFWQAMGLALMIGGGVGNLIDRSLYGRVVDFMNMGIGGLRTGIFNIADVYIMLGMFLILLSPYFLAKKEKESQEKPSQSSSSEAT